MWEVIADEAWRDLDTDVRGAILRLASEAGTETGLREGMGTLLNRDPALQEIWRRAKARAGSSYRGISPGTEPGPAHYWWLCRIPRCETKPRLGSAGSPYLERNCPQHGPLDGPFSTVSPVGN